MPDATPYRNFNFSVEIDGLGELQFSEVEIPGSWIEVVEYREGADTTSTTRTLPGRSALGRVILRRGIDRNLALWTWFKTVRDGSLDRRNVVITLLDAERLTVRRWALAGTWPIAYSSSTLDARGNEVVIETLELACARLEIEE